MNDIQQRWEAVQEKIKAACERSQRDASKVQVVAVTKYVDMERTRQALDSGLHRLGESRVQEALPKWEALGDRGEWHFIGHLQRNKVKYVVGRFTYLHSLDRYSLAEELSRRCEKTGNVIHCFLQVNVAGEDSKYGLAPAELSDFAREVVQLPGLKIEGLMTMAPHEEDPEMARPVFRELRSLQEQLQKLEEPGLSLPHLSMGMSNDYVVAVEEGATCLRLGSTLVGRNL